jgi:PhnB protein
MEKSAKIPEHYQRVMPYLIVDRASQFLVFMQTVFGAKETHRAMRDDQIIMHGELMIGDCTIMFADSTPKFLPRPAGMFVYVDDADQTYQKALAAGALSVTPMSDQPYGRSGGVLDPFGNTWWITEIG